MLLLKIFGIYYVFHTLVYIVKKHSKGITATHLYKVIELLELLI
jgi:hypothetical protein